MVRQRRCGPQQSATIHIYTPPPLPLLRPRPLSLTPPRLLVYGSFVFKYKLKKKNPELRDAANAVGANELHVPPERAVPPPGSYINITL